MIMIKHRSLFTVSVCMCWNMIFNFREPSQQAQMCNPVYHRINHICLQLGHFQNDARTSTNHCEMYHFVQYLNLYHMTQCKSSGVRNAGFRFRIQGMWGPPHRPLTKKAQWSGSAKYYRWCRDPLRKLVRTGTYRDVHCFLSTFFFAH